MVEDLLKIREAFYSIDGDGYLNQDKVEEALTLLDKLIAEPLAWLDEPVSSIEVSNMLHEFNLERPDIAALPNGATIAYNITTLRKAADLIKRLAAQSQLTFLDDEKVVEQLSADLWRRDYPRGGSAYKTYESTNYHDKELYRKEVRFLVNAIKRLAAQPTPTTEESGGL